jgi:hypothetical protein
LTSRPPPAPPPAPLPSQAIHELALLATYWGVTVDTIASVEPDPEYSRCLTLTGPDTGKEFTDFSRVALTITTKQGQAVKLQIDRCRAASATTMHPPPVARTAPAPTAPAPYPYPYPLPGTPWQVWRCGRLRQLCRHR